jgi:hypothetical protein
MDSEEIAIVLESCGKAFGFALARALVEPQPFTCDRVLGLATELTMLMQEGRFGPYVGLVLSGVATGLVADMASDA